MLLIIGFLVFDFVSSFGGIGGLVKNVGKGLIPLPTVSTSTVKKSPPPKTKPKVKKNNPPDSVVKPENKIPPSQRSGAVKISFNRGYGSNSPTAVLTANLEEGEQVDITGWRLASNTGEIRIPQAVPFYVVYSSNNNAGDIVLGPRDKAVIYFGAQSPIGKNFRLNRCTGFLNKIAEFSPPLPNDCYLPAKDDYRHLSGECQNYIMSLRRCELPDTNKTNQFQGELGNQCRSFINDNFGINACYRHKQEPDFLSNEWRVWIEQDIFDKYHDDIRLLNPQNQVIDEYVY